MRSRRQRRRICMRSIALFLIVAMLCTGLPAMPVMATETQNISSEDPTSKDALLSTQEPGNNEEETDLSGDTDPSGEENPSGDTDPSGETDPSEEENPSEETDPSEEENPSEETDPSEEENPSGETDLSEEEIPEETVSGNDITQSDIKIADDEEDDSMYRPEYLPLIEPFELPESGVPGSQQAYINDYASFESTYDSRKEGILTPIRNQNPWGTCWAFAAIGSMESSLLKQGLGTFDLSERHLAYFAYHTRNDALGIANDDTITTGPSPGYLNNGGNIMISVSALMNWQGAAAESKYPYVNNSTGPADLAREVSQDATVILKDCYMVNTKANDAETIQNVKTLIKQYGGVVWSYYDAVQFYNSTTHAYYNNVTKNESNHAIMVVGWDDNYSKNNFNISPKNNGAWVVRNSWSSNWGENGYFYISYEDTSLGSTNPAAVFIAGLREEYDHNYFNSNTMTGHNWAGKGNENLVTKMAQIYTIQGKKTGMEQVRAVSFLTGSSNAEYSIQIYRNPQKNADGVVEDPESGKPMLSKPVSGRTTYQGLYTIDLTQPVIAAKDDVIAIVITFPKGGYIGIDDNIYNLSKTYRYNNQVKMGESLVGNHLGFFDLAENDHTSLRINALTKDVESVFAVAIDDVRLTDFEGNGLVRLVWDPCPDAEKYEILRSNLREGVFEKIAEQSADLVESFEESIRAENTYYYKIRAVLTDGSTRESETVEVKADTIVFSSDISGHTDNMKAVLSWDPVAGATGYELSKKAPGQSDYITLEKVTGDTSYTDDLSDEDVGDYEYRLRAFNAEGNYTEWSSPTVVKFEFKVEQTAYNKVKFSWTEYYNAPQYMLLTNNYIIREIPSYLTEQEENMTERFNYHGLGKFNVGEDYTYGMFVGYAGSYWTPPIHVCPSVTFRTVPEVNFRYAFYAKGEGIMMRWENGAAQQVEIYRNTMPKRPETPYETVDADENYYTDTEVEEGTGYYYWLRPTMTNSSGELVEGEVTDSKYVAAPLLDEITELKSVKAISDTDVSISWESNPLSDGYSLYRSTVESEKGEKIAEITDNTETEYTDTGLSPGAVYYYSIAARVLSDTETKEDVLSPQAGVRMLPSVPVLKKENLTWSRGSVFIEWEKTEGADGYVLERFAAGETLKQIAEMNSADEVQYEDGDTLYDMRYVYHIKAYNTDINGKRQYAKSYGSVVFATPITPVSIKEIRAIDENSLQIIWDDVAEATSYALYRYAAGVYTPIKEYIIKKAPEDDTISYVDTECITGKTYYYKVLVNKNGTHSELDMTAAASGHTRPAMPTVVRATHDTITIQNNPSYEYAISRTYEKASALSYTYSTDTDSTETELTFEGLEPDSAYYIYVRTKQSVTDEEPVYGPVLQTTTKIKTELVLSSTDIVVSKGNRIDITSSLKPSNLHYTGLQWSAYRADEVPYVTQMDGSIFKVIGSDDKEILRITGNTLSATGESTDKEVYLKAEVDTLTAQCHVVVNVPVTGITMSGFKVNDEARDSLDDIRVSDEIEVSVSTAPAYNADDAACNWSTTNENVLKIIDSTDTSVTLKAEGVGNCVLKAYTADGISTEKKITVQKKEEVYGIWLTDKELSDTELSSVKVTSDENGSFEAEGMEAKPAYKLVLNNDTASTTDRVTVYAYALTAGNSVKDADGKVTGGSLARTLSCSYKSVNPLIAEVSEDGVITAKAPGETDIFAYDTTGNAVYGSCHIKVTGDTPQEETKTWPFDKAYKFSAVTSAVSIHSYDVDEKSSAKLRIKDQYGNEYTPQDNAKWFTFTSAKPSVCIVDEMGEVTPNPEYKPKKNETVTVTAALKNDLGKRKVTFKVTILSVKQVSSIEILSVNQTGGMQTQDAEVQYAPAPDMVRARYEKNGTMTFSAKAYDRFGEEMTTALQWSVTDTSIASVKVNADKSVTVTFKKPGRTNLVCRAKDTWKKSSSVELVLLDTTVVPSEKQVTLNLCQEMTADNWRLSGDFQLRIPAGADVSTLEIKEIKKGKEILAQDDVKKFSIVDKQNACYSIAIDNTAGYADSIKLNTTYELTVGTTVTGLAEIGDQQETFTVKVKVISKKPSVSVASPTINRIYTQGSDLKALLVIKAPDVVENVRVLVGAEGQVNQFDDYISVRKEGGQWYAVLDASKAYTKTSIKGKLALRVSGYEEVNCNVTIKTPKKAKAVKQQTIPSIYINAESSDAGENNTADITLYNNTDKAVLTQMKIESCTSDKLDVTVGDDGTLKAAVKQNVTYKNGETLTAQLKIMETDNAGNGVWEEPVSVTVKVKVYTTTLPKATPAQKTLTLNKKAQSEQAVTTLKLDHQNASFTPGRDWKIYAYNNTSKKYDIDVTENGWQSISFDKESGTLWIGFKPDKVEGVVNGSYKFRIMNHVKGHDNIYNDITVKVIDTNPTATVKVSGKLDLVNRENMTLTGKLTVKNAISQVKDVTILQEKDTSEDTLKEHPYFKAVYKGSNTFSITLTDEGKKAKLETKKYTLPVIITLEGGGRIETEMSFKPTQSVPKIKAPAAQTIYKYTGQLTKDYNLSQSLPSGVRIAKIQAVKVPEGMGVVIKNGHVLVTLNDTGMKKGSYQVNVNVYFEGEQELTGYPDGKPLSVKITVKVEN